MKVVWPLAFEIPLTVVMVELPLPAVKVTVTPLIVLPPFLTVTVIVDVAMPFAKTVVGLATAVGLFALGHAANTDEVVQAMKKARIITQINGV